MKKMQGKNDKSMGNAKDVKAANKVDATKSINKITPQTKSIDKAKDKPNGKAKNIWKIIAIAFIAVFALILIGGLVRLYHFEKSYSLHPTKAQIDSAKQAVQNDLSARQINASFEDIAAAPFSRKIRTKSGSIQVMEFSINNANIKQIYLIDLNSMQILMRSQTEFFGAMNDINKLDKNHFKKEGFESWMGKEWR